MKNSGSFRLNFLSTCLVFALGALSQNPADPEPRSDGLDILTCIRMTLEKDPQLAIQREVVRSGEGLIQSEQGVFDYFFFMDTNAAEDRDPLDAGGSQKTGSVSASGNASKLFRSGLKGTAQVSLDRRDPHRSGVLPGNTGSVRLELEYPLLEGRGRALTTAREAIADLNHQADVMDYRHKVATRVRDTLEAYWDYLTAVEALKITRVSVGRAEQLIEETKHLIEADEVAQNELIQLKADLAGKNAALISRENQVFKARQSLGLIMGLAPEHIRQLPPPATLFPEMENLTLPTPQDEDLFIKTSLERRSDYRAAEYRARIAASDLDIARDGLKPELDLKVSGGYNSLASGGSGDAFLEALFNKIPGANYSVALSYRFSLANKSAKGRFAQNHASMVQTQLRNDDLGRNISSDVMLALESLRSSYLGLQAARTSVELSQLAEENERKKYRLGFTTLIDLINFQDRLTNANQSFLNNSSQFMKALARLRFEIGNLIRGDQDRTTIMSDQFLEIPKLEEPQN